MVPRLQTSDDASLPLGVVVAGADHPLELPWSSPCRLDVLGGLVSPYGRSLHVYPIVVLGREDSCVLMPGSPRCDDVVVVAFPPPVVAAALDGALA